MDNVNDRLYQLARAQVDMVKSALGKRFTFVHKKNRPFCVHEKTSHVPSSHRPIKHLPNTKIGRIDFYNNYIIITINIGTFPRPHHLNGTMGRWDAGRTLLVIDET